MGRPSKLPELRDSILQLARAGNSRRIIAERVHVSESTIDRWLRWGNPDFEPSANEEYPDDLEPYREFWGDFRHAQTNPVVLCEAAWLTAAKEGNWQAAKAWLSMHRPDVYREVVGIEHAGSIEVDAAKITAALEEYQAIADRIVNGE